MNNRIAEEVGSFLSRAFIKLPHENQKDLAVQNYVRKRKKLFKALHV
jgi:hypothetical protein